MKIALVCDWLTDKGGAERVLLKLHKMFPEAPIYTSQYRPKKIDWFLGADVRTGYLQILPAKLRRFISPLRQLYFSKLDLSAYDVVISVTGAEAKSVKTGKAMHFCYCHVPTQYYWQLYDDYIKNPGFGILNPLVRCCFKMMVGFLRKADLKAAQNPDYFITISTYAAEQIKKYYGREAEIIAPPVDVEFFNINKNDRLDCEKKYYLNFSRQVSWKRLDLAIKSCIKNKKKLILIGDGPENKKLKRLAKGSDLIEFLPSVEQVELKKYLAKAKAFIFPSMEPFGIAPVEALAAGCPVIAFEKGGAQDYIEPKLNGILFKEQNVKSLSLAIKKLDELKFDEAKIAKSVRRFSSAEFEKKINKIIVRKNEK